ncbi:MAG TPA: tetratricopeptide repeat protein [Candidatus Methylacidiphilales bacterium]|nr:tetratricopeptide repeat protein [Candidatus Methylacidiphilales bacterium]
MPEVRKVASVSSQPVGLRHDWLFGLILVLAVILTYTPVWQAGFIWDDDEQLTGNPCIAGPLGLKEIWTTVHAGYYPLVLTTFWVEHAIWGWAPLPYHIVNVLLHGVCAVLLWRILRSLQMPGAWLGAALWALHPVQVETAAWVTELKNTQSGIFYLLAILFFLRWQDREILGEKGAGGDYALTLVFALLAILSKPSTVILPAVLGLCWWWKGGAWNLRIMLRLAPVILISAGASLWAMVEQKFHAGAEGSEWAQNWPDRLVIAGRAVWFYLGKLAWPHPLIFIYPRWQIAASQPLSYLPLAAVALVLAVLWRYRNQGLRPVFFIFAYFLIALFPVLGFFDFYFFRFSFVGDHFQYLASMGPLALAGAGLAMLADFALPGKIWLRSGLGTGLLLILAVASWRQIGIYQNLETLWLDTLAKNPDCWMGHNNLGNIFAEQGQIDDAMVEYQKALDLNPNYPDAQNDLGAELLQKGRMDEAIAHFRKALEIDPDYSEVHYNLGFALLQEGRAGEAIVEFQNALRLKSDYPEAQDCLAQAQAMARQKGSN